jgi:aspartyl-tRNA(Asn)/glutamyl-tRNA(Gln) amidotransferase subunit A
MTAGLRTTCGSRMLTNFTAPYDAFVVEGLRNAGTVLIGKTNMDEFAMGSSNETHISAPSRIPGTPNTYPAAAQAARRPPSRRAWCRERRAPTRAVRFANPRRCPASAA